LATELLVMREELEAWRREQGVLREALETRLMRDLKALMREEAVVRRAVESHLEARVGEVQRELTRSLDEVRDGLHRLTDAHSSDLRELRQKLADVCDGQLPPAPPGSCESSRRSVSCLSPLRERVDEERLERLNEAIEQEAAARQDLEQRLRVQLDVVSQELRGAAPSAPAGFSADKRPALGPESLAELPQELREALENKIREEREVCHRAVQEEHTRFQEKLRAYEDAMQQHIANTGANVVSAVECSNKELASFQRDVLQLCKTLAGELPARPPQGLPVAAALPVAVVPKVQTSRGFDTLQTPQFQRRPGVHEAIASLEARVQSKQNNLTSIRTAISDLESVVRRKEAYRG